MIYRRDDEACNCYTTSHTSLHHTTLHHTTPNHTTPHMTPHNTIPHHTTHDTTHDTTPHHTTHDTTQHYTTPHHLYPILMNSNQSFLCLQHQIPKLSISFYKLSPTVNILLEASSYCQYPSRSFLLLSISF